MQLLDANILIDYLNNVSSAVEFMGSIDPKKTAISSVTLTEVLVGCNQNEKQIILLLIEPFTFFDIDRAVAIRAANLRQDYRWKLPDAFQAAIAVEHKLTLMTRNTKDFNPAVHKFVKIPYKLRSK